MVFSSLLDVVWAEALELWNRECLYAGLGYQKLFLLPVWVWVWVAVLILQYPIRLYKSYPGLNLFAVSLLA